MTVKKKINRNPFERTQPLTSDFFDIPLIGMVGHSTSGDYHLSDLVSNFHHANQEYITLEVLDSAMQKAGILKGDYLTVDLNSQPHNGDITVVKLGERFYIRKFYQQNDLVRLETADEYPDSLVIQSKTPGFSILGKVQSVFREF